MLQILNRKIQIMDAVFSALGTFYGLVLLHLPVKNALKRAAIKSRDTYYTTPVTDEQFACWQKGYNIAYETRLYYLLAMDELSTKGTIIN